MLVGTVMVRVHVLWSFSFPLQTEAELAELATRWRGLLGGSSQLQVCACEG